MSSRRSSIPPAEWEDPRHRLGLAGEHEVMAFLVAQGWAIEAHRFRRGRHEIDLVARKDRTVAFVEVKTRRSTRCGDPREAIPHSKRRVLFRVAEFWALKFGRDRDEYRFDVAAVTPRGDGTYDVEVIEDAWRG